MKRKIKAEYLEAMFWKLTVVGSKPNLFKVAWFYVKDQYYSITMDKDRNATFYFTNAKIRHQEMVREYNKEI